MKRITVDLTLPVWAKARALKRTIARMEDQDGDFTGEHAAAGCLIESIIADLENITEQIEEFEREREK